MGIIDRIGRGIGNRSKGQKSVKRFNPLVVEAVEPRLLMSTTALTGHQAQNLAQALHDNLLHFEEVLAGVDQSSLFTNTLPLIAGSDGTSPATLGSLTRFETLLDADVISPIQAYITQISNGTKDPVTAAALASDLQTEINSVLGSTGSVTITDHSTGNDVDLSFSMSTTVSEHFGLTLGSNTNITGLTVPSDLQGTLTLKLTNFNFETVIDASSKILTDSEVQASGSADLLDGFSLSNAGVDVSLSAALSIPKGQEFDAGLLSLVTTSAASVDYSAALHFTLSGSSTGDVLKDDAAAEANGDLSFLTGTLNATVDQDANVVLSIPIELSDTDTEIPGLGTGFSGHIAFNGSVLGGNWSSQTVRDSGLSLDTIQHFATLSPANIVSAFQTLDTYFSDLTGSSLTDQTLPFTHGLTIGQVIDFASNFEKDVVDKLTPISDTLGFTSNQTVTAADGSHAATLTFNPEDLSGDALPGSFNVTLNANGDVATLALTNQYADAQGNLHTITSVDDLALAINQALAGAAAGSTLATVASELTVTAVNDNTETLAISGKTVTLGGTVTAGDVVSLQFTNAKGLTSGPVTVTYNSTSADTIGSVATNLAAAINGDAALKAAGITASVSGSVLTVATAASGGTTVLGVPDNAIQLQATATGSDFSPASIAIAAPAASFTNIVGLVEDLGQALGYGNDISNVEQFFTDLGFHYDAQANAIEFTLDYQTGFTLGSDPTETLSADPSSNTVTVGGAATAGDTVTVTVTNPALADGSHDVSYIVQANDTLDGVTTGLINAINDDATLKAAGVTAVAGANPDTLVVSGGTSTALATGASGSIAFDAGGSLGDGLASLEGSGNLSLQASLGLSMTVGFSLDSLGAQADGAQILVNGQPLGASTPVFDIPTIANTKITALTADDVADTTGLADMQLILRDGTLATLELQHGEIVDHIGGGAAIIVAGTATDPTSLNIGGTATAGDQINVTVNYGGHSVTVTTTVGATDSSTSIATEIAAAIGSDATLSAAGVTASASANTVLLGGTDATMTAALVGAHGNPATETIDQQAITIGDLLNAFDQIKSGNVDVAVSGSVATGNLDVTVGGDVAVGDTVSLTLSSGILSEPVAVSYTVVTGDTAATIASHLASAINGSSALSTASIDATWTSGDTFLVTGGATVALSQQTASLSVTPEEDVELTGSVTPGDVMSVTIGGAGLGTEKVAVSYTVAQGDTLADVAAGLQAAINDNATLSDAGIQAAVLSGSPDTITLTGNPTVKVGSYSSALSETADGGLQLTGTPQAGSILAVSVTPTGGAATTASYIVQQGDTADDMIAQLAVAIGSVSPEVSDSVEAVIEGTTSINVANDQYLVDDGDDITLGVLPLVGAQLNLTVDGEALTVTVRKGYDQPEEVIAAIVDAINDAGIAGVSADLSASISGAKLGAPSVPSETVSLTPDADQVITGAGDAGVGAVLSLQITPTGGTAQTIATTLQQGDTVADGLAHLVDAVNASSLGVSVGLTGTISGGELSDPTGSISDGGDSFYVDSHPSGTSSITVDGVTVSYQAQSGDTASDVIAALMDQVNANTTLQADGVTGSVAMTVSGGAVAVSAAPGETISSVTAVASGSPITTGDVLSMVFDSSKLSAPIAISYVVQSDDTLATIATGLMTAIDANQALTDAHITATIDPDNADQLVITGNPSVTTNPSTLGMSSDHNGDITLTGIAQTGDVLALKVTPTSGSAYVASYTLQDGDSQADALAKLVDAIETGHAGVTADMTGTVSGITSMVTATSSVASPNDDASDLQLDDATGTIEVSAAHTGDNLVLVVNGETVSYVVKAGHTTAQDVVAGLVDAINAAGLSGVSASLAAEITGASVAVPLGATETLGISPAAGGISAIYNASTMEIELHDGTVATGVTPTSYGFSQGESASSAALTTAPSGAVTASNYYQAVLVGEPTTSVDYTAASNFLLTLGNLAPIEISVAADATRTTADGFADAVNAALAKLSLDPTLLGLSPGLDIGLAINETTGHAGDTVSMTIHNSDLAGGELVVSYTVASGDTAANIATGLAAAVNGNSTLSADNITATVNGTTVTVATTQGTSTLSGTASTTAETIAAATISYSQLIGATGDAFTVQGAPTVGDVISLQVEVGGSAHTITYTVKSGDTDDSVATGLATAMGALTGVQASAMDSTVVFAGTSGGTVTVTNGSAASNTEQVTSSLTFATMMYNVVSASASNATEQQAAQFGLTISPVDTNLYALNGSSVVSVLGFSGLDQNSLADPTGLITSGALYDTTLSDRFFFKDTQIVADLDLELSNLSLTGMLGFLGFQATGEGYVHLEAKLALQSPTGSDFLTFHQLSDAFTDGDLNSLWSFTVGAPDEGGDWADLKVDSIQLVGGNTAGNVISDLTNALVQPGVEIAYNSDLTSISDFLHAKPQITVTGFDNVENLKDLSFSDIVAGLQTVLQVIDNDTGSSILDTTIPVVGVSINDVLNYAQDFSNFLTQLSSNPAGTVAEINTVIQNALGPIGSDVNLSYTDGALMLGFDFSPSATESVPFAIDLASLAADAGVTLPAGLTSLIGVDASGSLSVTAGADLGVSLGIQLKALAATDSTSLSSLNKGKGIATNGTSAPDIVITTGSLYQFAVDLDAIVKTDTLAVSGSTVTVAGTATAGETLSVTVDNATLDGTGAAGSGAVTVTVTVGSGANATTLATAISEAINANSALVKGGVTATVTDGVVTLTGATTITTSVGGTLGEMIATINSAAQSAGLGAGFATLDSSGDLVFTDAGTQAQATVGNAEGLGFTPQLSITGANTVTASVTGAVTASVSTDQTTVTVGGTPHAGDTVKLTVNGQALTYTVQSGDTISIIDDHLATLVNALSISGLSAKEVGQAAATTANSSATIGGTETAGDTVSLTVSYGAGKTETFSYTVVAGDTAQTIAAALATAANADAALKTGGVTAVANGASVSVVAASGTVTLAGQAGGSATETVTVGATDVIQANGTTGSPSSAYTVDLVFGGQTVALTVGADNARTTMAGLVDAINQALAAKSIDLGFGNSANSGTAGTLSDLLGAVLDNGAITFVAAQSNVSASTDLSIANLPDAALGITALGFTGAQTATDTNAVETITTTLPANIDFTKEYEFQIVVNGVPATIDLKADPTRDSVTAFVNALNLALGGSFLDQSALGLGSSGKTIVGGLVDVTSSGTTPGSITLTFTANDAALGTKHALSIEDVASSATPTLTVADLNGSDSAESLGFAAGSQTVSAAAGANRVLTGTELSDNSTNHSFFIDTTNTGLTFSIQAVASNLNFDTNIGPISVSVDNGSAILGAEEFVNGALPLATDKTFAVSATAPGTLHFGLKDGVALNEQGDAVATAGRLYFSEISAVSSERSIVLGGTETAGDQVYVTIQGAKLSAAETVSYTVVTGDTSQTIATKLAAAINADSTLQAAGIDASVVTGTNEIQVYGASVIAGGVNATPSDSATPNTATEHISVVNGYANLIEVDSNIAISVTLPISVLGVPISPALQIGIGNLLGGPSGWALDPTPWSLNIPSFSNFLTDLKSAFNPYNFLNNPEAIINGLNGLLGALDTLFTQQVFGTQLPLIGGALADAGDFIGSIRSTLVGDMTGLVNDYKSANGGQDPTTADIVQDAVNELLGSLGFSGGITITVDAAAKEIDFALTMTKDLFNGTINLSSDLGIPGLGLSISNGQVGLDLSTTISLDFAYSSSQGFYMLASTAGQHAVALNFAVTIPSNFSVALTLGILELAGTNGSNVFTNADNTTSTGTTLVGGVFVDLHSKTTDGLADLGSTNSLVAAVDASGNQTISLTLPTIVDTQAAYAFQLVINGTAVTINVAADSTRTTEAGLVTAINSALSQATIAKSVVDSTDKSTDTESLSTLGVTASLSGTTLTFTVADKALGSTPSFALQDTHILFSQVGSDIRAEIAANFDLDLDLQAETTGGSMELPSVNTEMLFAYQMDKVLVGTDNLAQTGVLVPFTFKDVTLDMGEFLSEFLMPILNAANEILSPLMPVLDFITAPLPGISNIVGHSVSLLDIASLLGADNSDIATITNAITLIDEVENLIQSIKAQSSGGSIMYNFGTFTFGNATIGPLANAPAAAGTTSAGSSNFDPLGGDSLSNYSLSTSSLSSLAPQSTGSNASQAGAIKQVNGIQNNGAFSLPILHDPIAILELLTGETSSPVTLFQWKLPTVSFNFGKTWEFPVASLAGIISIDAILGINVNVSLNVTFGYDTEGYEEYKQTGNAFYIFDGFYVDDTVGPQLTLSASVTAGAALDLTFVQVSLTGTIGAQISLQLYDPNGDGRVRPSEIISELEALDNPLDLFVVSGDVYARVDLNVWIGIHIPLLGTFTIYSHDFNFVNATLVSFTLTPPSVPVLATQSSDGTVTLNTGTLSDQRLVGNTSSSADDYSVTQNSDGSVTIDSNGTSQTLNGVTKIVADTGDGNSDFTLHNLDTPITITGGDGNNFVDAGGSNDGVFTFGDGNNTVIGTNAADTITVGNGNNTIIDGTGNDIITAGNGNNYISGNGGNDTITVGSGNNTIVGGAGNNTISAGGGNNIIFGGQATSIATTISNAGSTYTVYGADANGNISNTGATGDGSDIIKAGSGDNIIFGGTGSDSITLSGAGDSYVIAHTGTAVVTSAANFAANGHAAIVGVTATGTVGGNDLINAQDAFGDNVILGGEGNNYILGGNGTNVIVGHDGSVDGAAGGSNGEYTIAGTSAATGTDTIVAGVGNDVLIGGPGNDTITGGPGSDIIAGGDATVVRTEALGSSAALLTMTATPDGSTGIHTIIAGSGDDVVIGGGGESTIEGGDGTSILMGGYGTVDISSGTDVVVTGTADTVGHTDGNNTVTAGYGNNVIMGGGGSNYLTAGNGSDVFFGNDGVATLTLSDYSVISAHTNTESGGGNDTILISGSGNNVAFGGAGDNSITVTGTGNNVVLGGLGALSFTGSTLLVQGHDATDDTNSTNYPSANIITIGAGASGSNVVMGGAGADTITVDANGNNVVLGDSGTATLSVGTGGALTPVFVTTKDGLTSGEESIGGNNTIAINGNGSNVVLGGAGDNTIGVNGTGNNVVLGGLGNVTESATQFVVAGHDHASDTGNVNYPDSDIITVGAGASGTNVVMGGAGENTITVDANGNNVVLGHAGVATLTVGTGGSLTPVFVTTTTQQDNGEESIGGNNTITLNGNGNNVVAGGAGDNLITVTGTGNNVVLGGLGELTESAAQFIVASHDHASDTGNVNYPDSDVITVAAGASGSNVVMGAAGHNTITVDANGNNVVLGHSGVATLTVGTGGALIPVFVTTTTLQDNGEESIGGNNTIAIDGNGNNVVMGGAGDNAITVDGSGDNVVLGALGNMTLSATTLVVAGHDAASDTNNEAYANTDVILIKGGGSGSNVAMGGAGSDTITIDANGNNVVFGDSGVTTLTVGTGGLLTPVFVTTTDLQDHGEESIGGNNTIAINGNGNNAVMGGAGNNSITVEGTGNNVVLGALGYMTLSSTKLIVAGHDAASDTGNEAYASSDVILVGAGGTGSNVVMGGAGADTITINANGSNVVLGDSGVATLTVGSGGSLTPVFVTTTDLQDGGEESIGGGDTIAINGNGHNVVMGGAGDNTIVVNGTGDNVVLGALGDMIFTASTLLVNGHDAASDTGNTNYPSSDVITIQGVGTGSNIVMGGAGADTITVAASGNNYVLGDSGVAKVTVGAGGAYLLQNIKTVDTNKGGEESLGGNDTIAVTGNGDNVVMGGAGENTIAVNGTGNNVVLGDLGIVTLGATLVIDGYDAASDTGLSNYSTDNVITLGAEASGTNVVMGGVGNNIITQNGDGKAYILGHNGQALLTHWYTKAPVLKLLTTDTIKKGGEEQIGGDNTIAVNGDGNNVVMGGAGNNTITVSGDGNNSVLGHLGQLAPIKIDGISGYDLLGHNTALGDASHAWDDVITLTKTASGDNTIMGGAGNNTITVLGAGDYTHYGDNVIFGASGEVNPVLAQTMDEAYGGNNTITIGALAGGDNTIFGGVGNNVVKISGAGDNSVFGNQGEAVAVNGVTPDLIGRDTAIGGNDRITITAGANGNNVVMGEGGSNIISSKGTGLNVLMGHTGLITHQQIGDRLYPETVTSTDFGIGGNNTITGSKGDNVIIGGVGNNTLTGGTGHDYIIGHDGDVDFGPQVATTRTPLTMYTTEYSDGGKDVISTGDGPFSYAIGGTGTSTISGGAGNDLLAAGQAAIDWGATGDRTFFTTVVTNQPTSDDDTITGGGGDNDILGSQGGGDTLTGGPGSNIVIGHGGEIWFKNNTEVTAQTLNVFSRSPDLIIGGGTGHNFLFGGGTVSNDFKALPLSDLIYNTDGRVDLLGGTSNEPYLKNPPVRTGEWTLPPFLGNPVVSMVGNWFTYIQPVDLDDAGIDLTATFYNPALTIAGYELQATEGLAGYHATATAEGDIYPAPAGMSLTADAELSQEFVTGALDWQPIIGGTGEGLFAGDEDGTVIRLETADLSQKTFIFDARNGVWVEDSTPVGAPVLDLAVGPAPTIVFDDEEEFLLAAE